MLSRFLFSARRSLCILHSLTLTTTTTTFLRPLPIPPPRLPQLPRAFSAKPPTGAGGGDGSWMLAPDSDDPLGALFEEDVPALSEDPPEGGPVPAEAAGGEWAMGRVGEEAGKKGGDIFAEIDRELQPEKSGGSDEWETAEGFKPWSFGEEANGGDVFGIAGEEPVGELDGSHVFDIENEKAEETAKLELQEKELKAVLKGPDRAFGDLIAASGITDEMLDSLILLKDVSGVQGLPSLREIEDAYIENSDDISRFEDEKKKQEEIAKARVKQVDDKGRAYGTGRRKCSIARVFLQPGDGKFVVNDKPFDAYFPSLDHRAELLGPFNVTDTVGCWDVRCTVKGGGVSGQVGAIRLGISRALQNFEPGFRQYLRPEGYLTRDSRVVERKKPGKAKARKSFQWVKR